METPKPNTDSPLPTPAPVLSEPPTRKVRVVNGGTYSYEGTIYILIPGDLMTVPQHVAIVLVETGKVVIEE